MQEQAHMEAGERGWDTILPETPLLAQLPTGPQIRRGLKTGASPWGAKRLNPTSGTANF